MLLWMALWRRLIEAALLKLRGRVTAVALRVAALRRSV